MNSRPLRPSSAAFSFNPGTPCSNTAVVVVDRHLLARPVGCLPVPADAERPVGVDAPRQLDPELVLLPDLAGVDLAGVGDGLAEALAGLAQHRLAEADPLPVVLLVADHVVALGGVPHRQDVVGEVRGLVPRRRQRHVQPELGLVQQGLDPAEAVGVGPHRVVDAAEVGVDRAAALGHELGQQERHLVHRERVLQRQVQLVPHRHRVGVDGRSRLDLVPAVGVGPAGHGDRAHQRVEEQQAARDLPAALVGDRCRAPRVGRQPAAGAGDGLGDRQQARLVDARLGGGEREGVRRVLGGEQLLEHREGLLALGVAGGEELAPVEPALDVVAVVRSRRDQVVGDGQQDGGLAARVRRDPVVGGRGGVGQPHVHHDELRAALAGLGDALRVRVEVVPGLQVAGDQQDHVRLGMVRARAVLAHPERVARAGPGGADVGVGVVPVHAPRLQHLGGEPELAGPADVVDDLVLAVLEDRGADAPGDVVQGLVPRRGDPAALATAAGTLHRVQDAVGVGDLGDRRRALGAVAPT